jgi:hypothetical protein
MPIPTLILVRPGPAPCSGARSQEGLPRPLPEIHRGDSPARHHRKRAPHRHEQKGAKTGFSHLAEPVALGETRQRPGQMASPTLAGAIRNSDNYVTPTLRKILHRAGPDGPEPQRSSGLLRVLRYGHRTYDV